MAVLFAGIGVAAAPTAALGKPPIPCGTIYTIERGDTLFKVANRAYADGHQFDRIYGANRDLLPDEASVEIGDQLLIPCPDGSGPGTRREAIAQGMLDDPEGARSSGQTGETAALAPPTEPTLATMRQLLPPPASDAPMTKPGGLLQKAVEMAKAAALPGHFVANPTAPESLPTRMYFDPVRASETATDTPDPVAEATPHARIRFLADAEASPYAGRQLPHGGMITELVTRAVKAAAPEQAFRITFVANDSTHIEDLLTDGAFDVGFPWYKPDCGAPELGPKARAVCLALKFSRPLVEVRFGYYARRDDPVSQIADHAGLLGKRLCRPAGRFMSDLDQGELAALPLAIIRMESARDCFRKLADDEVDAVQMVKPDATGMIRSMGLAGQVREIETLESTRMLYAVAPRGNAGGPGHIDLINRGLEVLMMSGSWFEVVASHQSERLAHSN